MSVTCAQERVFDSWIERTMRVDEHFTSAPLDPRDAAPLVVQQYHFTAWPDKDVPDTPIQFLNYLCVLWLSFLTSLFCVHLLFSMCRA